MYGVKEFVRLSVIKFDPNYLRTGKIEWAEIVLGLDLSSNLAFASEQLIYYFLAGNNYPNSPHLQGV